MMRALLSLLLALLAWLSPLSVAANGVIIPGVLDVPLVPAQPVAVAGGWTWGVPCGHQAALVVAGENTVVFGHAYHRCGSPMSPLYRVRLGAVVWYDGRAWTVQERHIVSPREVAWVLPTADTRLTLLTCWPAYSARWRLVLVARPYAATGGR